MKVALYLLVLISISLVALWAIAKWNETQAETTTPPSGRFVETANTKLHLKIEGSGPPIVLIHGASGNFQDLTFLLAPALRERFTVISIDRPGLGYSPSFSRDGETLSEQANVISAVLQELGIEHVYVLGQSYGGSVALRLALDHPDLVVGLALVAAPSNTWGTPLGRLYSLTSGKWTGPLMRLLIASVTPKSVVDASLAGVFEPQEVPDGYAKHIGVNLTLRRSQQRANALQVAALKPQIEEMVPLYDKISIPVEAIHGTADTIVPLHVHTEILAKQISDITVTILEGVGHMPHQTHTDEVLAIVDRLHAKVGLKPAK